MASCDQSINERSQKLLQELYNSKDLGFDEVSKLLTEFRVLTREKTLKSDVLDQNCLTSLVNYSKGCQTEAQKCLSNLILNYAHLREGLVEPYVNCVYSRLTDILNKTSASNMALTSKKQKCEILYYDLRIIFLLSALCPASRANIRDRLVNPILSITSIEADEYSQDNHLLVIESLKTLFNLTLVKCTNILSAGDVIKKLFVVVGTEKDTNIDVDKNVRLELNDQLLVNLIYLLTNMPEEVYLKLTDDDVDKILNHLDNQLKTYSKQNFRDTVLPVLNVCANICKYNGRVRKRWFEDIVGSVKDFQKRPEEYDTLRGRLVKLMTSVDVHIKDIAAEFMHALCGGDTEKLITYTGFGNSAAFLSSRGLLSGCRKERDDTNNSGNEVDYKQLRDKIDPITGKLDLPRKNPMEGMSEEEKEFHAQELADAITKLSNLGVVKPLGLDKDGNLTDLHPSSLERDKG